MKKAQGVAFPPPPPHETAVARAKQLAEAHRSRIALAEQQRQLPPETARDLVQSGLARALAD